MNLHRLPHLLKALVAVAAVTLAAAWPVYALGGRASFLALLLAAGVSLLGAAAGRLPRLLLRDGSPEIAVGAVLGGVGARLLVTAALALVVVLVEPVPVFPFAVWLVVFYFLLLVLEASDAITEMAGAEHAPDGGATAP